MWTLENKDTYTIHSIIVEVPNGTLSCKNQDTLIMWTILVGPKESILDIAKCYMQVVYKICILFR